MTKAPKPLIKKVRKIRNKILFNVLFYDGSSILFDPLAFAKGSPTLYSFAMAKPNELQHFKVRSGGDYVEWIDLDIQIEADDLANLPNVERIQ